MTREEVLAYAISQKAGLESEINKSNCGYGNWVMYSAELDFTNACISALKGPTREQVEKVWRGEWIAYLDGEHIIPGRYYSCSKCGGRGHLSKRNFCDFCGAPMTDKAVDMVMERMEEVLRDGKEQ